MDSETAAPRVVIASSNLNIEPWRALAAGHEGYIDFLHHGNFDEEAGFEWTPLRFPAARHAGRLLAAEDLVTSLHESWRETGWRDLPALGNVRAMIGEAAIGVAFPMLHNSYEPLDWLQLQTARYPRLPIVIHPAGQQLGGKPERADRPRQAFDSSLFSNVLIQPTAEWARSVGIIRTQSMSAERTASLIDEALQERGFGMALDLHHLRTTRDGVSFGDDPEALAGALAARIVLGRDEIQVSIRPEFGGDYDEAKRIFFEGVGGTVLGRMLQAAGDQAPAGTLRLVSEVQAGVVKSVVGKRRRLSQVHVTINDSVRELMAA